MNSGSIEAAYVAFLSLLVGARLLDRPFLIGIWFVLVSAAAITQASFFPAKLKKECLFEWYTTRRSKSQGVLIGLLSVPCLLASLAISSPEPRKQDYWMHIFHASCCCSLCLVSFLTNIIPGPTLTSSTFSSLASLAAILSPLSSLFSAGSRWASLPLSFLILPLATLPCYHLLLKHLKGTFTLGEAAIVCQGGLILSSLAFEILYDRIQSHPFFMSDMALESSVILVPFWILILAISTWSLASSTNRLSAIFASTFLSLSVLSLSDLALWVLFTFLPRRNSMKRRSLIIAYWIIITAATLPVMNKASKWIKGKRKGGLSYKSWLALLRKGYHLLLLAIFLPVLLVDHDMLCVSASIAFAAMIFLETIRCSGLLPSKASTVVQSFMESFTDERDSGPICTTHISLLLGASAPLWISMSPRPGLINRQLALSGLVCLGVGDTAASVVGILWPGEKLRLFSDSNKTLQGAIAGLVSMLLFWFCAGISNPLHVAALLPVALTTFGSSLLEASTHQIDNLVLPIVFVAHLLLSHPANNFS